MYVRRADVQDRRQGSPITHDTWNPELGQDRPSRSAKVYDNRRPYSVTYCLYIRLWNASHRKTALGPPIEGDCEERVRDNPSNCPKIVR